MLDLAEKFKEFSEQRATRAQMSINSKVLLVDSMNTYIRCFCATPTMNDDGEHVGGVSGFLKSVGQVARNTLPSRVICVFDGAGGSRRRRKLFENYKFKKKTMQRLNRTYDFNTDDDEKRSMRWQLSFLVELLESLPVTTMAIENIEADDTIAYLSHLITDRGGESVIMSTDRDFFQLVNETCTVYNPIKKKIYDVEKIVEEYGIHPNNFLLARTLTGDPSDNVPGIKGIGFKSIAKYFPDISQEKQLNPPDLVSLCYKENGKVKNATCGKIIEAQKDGTLSRNNELMSLSGDYVSGVIKLKIVELFDNPVNDLDKHSLTLKLNQFKLLSAFNNFDTWLRTTWGPLVRFSENK